MSDPKRVESIFLAALDQGSAAERADYLDHACGDDAALRHRVERLLEAHPRAVDFLAQPAVDRLGCDAHDAVEDLTGLAPTRSSEAIPRDAAAGIDRIDPTSPEILPGTAAIPASFGRYRLLRLYGEGGMGTVYEAEQDNPRRTVALKVIRPGLVSPEHVKRFRHEAQILARLQHPGIAQIHEAGIGEDGRPFFAMEFIRGLSLDEYARSRGLDTAARLELLARVCDAVQHAHDRGVIHRDLKPGNILVDASGQPKVLDFGVAHVTTADLLTTSSRTQTGQLLGTLSYMSPEQIAADHTGLDGRSDVYTLGVLLFELLAHRLPYQLEHLPVHEVARVIQLEEPSRLGSIDRVYRGDVEIIVAKALEKEKTRRYAAAGDLASDIRRYLRGEAILARQVSTAERYWRWTRRHWSSAVLGGVLAGVLVLATVSSLLVAERMARLAENERNWAQAERWARQEADRARNEARARERAERWERYRSNIAEAAAAQQLQNSSSGRRALETAPEEFRNWEWRHLHSLLDGASLVLPVPAMNFLTMCLSPDARQVAVASDQGAIHLFDVATGRPGPVLRGHAGAVESLEYSPDGRQLGSGARDGTIRLWDAATGRQQFVLRGDGSNTPHLHYRCDGRRISSEEASTQAGMIMHRLWDATTGHPLAVLGDSADTGSWQTSAFRPDGKRVVAAAGRFLRMVDADTGREISVLGPHEWPVDRIVFSPDGKRFVVNHSGGPTPVSLRDGDNGLVVAVLKDQESPLYQVAFSPDGSRLATTCLGPEGTSVRLWQTGSGKRIATMPGHTNTVNSLRFSPDGKRLVSASHDQTGRLWDGETGQRVAVLRGHTGPLMAATFSPDGTRLVTASRDGTLRLWDAGSGDLITVLRGHMGGLGVPEFTSDSSRLISPSADGTLRVWDMRMAERNGVLRGHARQVDDVAFRRDGKEVASSSWDGTVRLWDPDIGRETRLLRTASEIVSAVAYSPDGGRLATSSRALGVALWKADDAEREYLWPGPTGTWKGDGRVAFSPDGTLVAAGSAAGPVRLWEVATGERVAELRGHEGGSGDVAFAPAGATLASAGLDGTIRLWDVATRKALATLRGHAGRVIRVAYSSDGGLIASGSDDDTLRIWDSRAHALLSTIQIGSRVYGVAFSPDGTRLALGCGDTTIRLIDVAAREEVVGLRGHADSVRAVAWSPDGTRLVSASGDLTLRVWDSLSIQARARASQENLVPTAGGWPRASADRTGGH